MATTTPADAHQPVIVYATFPSADLAEQIGGLLLDRGLAACVNIGQPVTSIYIWQGRRCRDTETPMIIKTRGDLVDRVVAEVRALHSFDNPALLALPVTGGSADFMHWIVTQTVAAAPSGTR